MKEIINILKLSWLVAKESIFNLLKIKGYGNKK